MSDQTERSIANPTHADELLLAQLLSEGAAPEVESPTQDDYLDQAIAKPWGYEYRIYSDSVYDCWALALAPGARTSSHCHCHKTTTLVCLSGRARVQLLNRSLELEPNQYLQIRPGTFHATHNIHDEQLDLLEVETPRNKLDLVRASDSYGRRGQGYERRVRLLELAPLIATKEPHGARIRACSADGRFRFSLSPCAQEPGRESASWLLAIELAAGASRSIQVAVGRPTPAAVDLI